MSEQGQANYGPYDEEELICKHGNLLRSKYREICNDCRMESNRVKDTCLCKKSTSPDGPYQLNPQCPLHGYTGDHMSEEGRTNYYREKDNIPINTPFTDYA